MELMFLTSTLIPNLDIIDKNIPEINPLATEFANAKFDVNFDKNFLFF